MADSGSDYLGLVGLLAAAGIASAGAIYNNRQQRKLQESTNSEAINLANTAHQREVADLQAAGLNPILSATGSGASTPSLGTAQLDNVLDSFGGSARGIGEMLSKQRSLENEALDIDNGIQALEQSRRELTFQPDLHSAIAEANKNRTLAEYEDELISDKMAALHDLKYDYVTDDGSVKLLKNSYKKNVRDSVKAEVKESGTKYLQGWSNNIRGWVDTGIDAINTAKGFGAARLRNDILRHRLERMK